MMLGGLNQTIAGHPLLIRTTQLVRDFHHLVIRPPDLHAVVGVFLHPKMAHHAGHQPAIEVSGLREDIRT